MESNQQVGSKIRSIRESKQMSMEELAQRAALPLSQVEVIENNVGLPSLAPLIAIARVLGVRLGTFLDDHEELGPIIQKGEGAVGGFHFSNNSNDNRTHMAYHSLAASKVGRHFDPFLIDVQPLDPNAFSPSTHEGEEFIYVLEGAVEINYGKEVYTLSKGDSIYYDSIVSHHVHAATADGAMILAIVYTPF